MLQLDEPYGGTPMTAPRGRPHHPPRPSPSSWSAQTRPSGWASTAARPPAVRHGTAQHSTCHTISLVSQPARHTGGPSRRARAPPSPPPPPAAAAAFCTQARLASPCDAAAATPAAAAAATAAALLLLPLLLLLSSLEGTCCSAQRRRSPLPHPPREGRRRAPPQPGCGPCAAAAKLPDPARLQARLASFWPGQSMPWPWLQCVQGQAPAAPGPL